MNNIKDKKIAIIGGGPGGLTLARILQMNGADVQVYERDADKDARPKGATLDLHDESGLRALREAGLMDAFRKNYRPGADRMKIMDKHANIIADDETDKEGALARPEIDRGPLQNILLESLLPGTVIWGKQFVSMESKLEGWLIEFKDGSMVYADIVIGADGANSKIRPNITSIKPYYVGIMAIEGAVHHSETQTPHIHKLLNDGKLFIMGDSKSLIVASKGDGSLVFYPSFKKQEDWSQNSHIDFNNKAQVLAWFKEEYEGWSNTWEELFENADSKFILRPQYCMPPDQTWETLPNLTILGDAAHVMPPFAGEGVNMAMLDALELSNCLLNDEYPDVKSAIASYEKEMLKRASETAADTLVSTDALHSPEAISFLMNIVG